MAFSGWPEEALEFFDGLAADNTKSYWTAHKPVYEEYVLRPMAELVEDLTAEFGPGRIFRPYRDVRFSKDKSPYQTHIAAAAGGGYIRLAADGLAAGAGMYAMTPRQLDAYRRAVAADGPGQDLERVIAEIGEHSIGVSARDELKTAPRGYPPDHPRIALLRYKSIIAWQQWPVEPWLETPAVRDRIAGFLRATRPLADWLAANVGAAE